MFLRGDLEALRREDSRRWLPIPDREDAPQEYRGDAVNALSYLARADLLAGEPTTAALMLEATVQEATGGPGAS